MQLTARVLVFLAPLATGWLLGYLPMQIVLAGLAVAAAVSLFVIQDRKTQGVLWEVLAVSLILMLGAFLVHNTIVNLANRKIATGFDFLDRDRRTGQGMLRHGRLPPDGRLRSRRGDDVRRRPALG